jgi:hypothetical protein
VFDVPAGLVRILDRDLVAAGIPKRDERGRTVDVHALRTTFGTLLSKTGAAPRTAQEAMRHSDIRLTMGTYTDPKLLDVAGAIEALPALPLSHHAPREPLAATGTDTPVVMARQFAPGFAPTTDKPATPQPFLTIPDNLGTAAKKRENPRIPLGKRGFSGVSRQWAIQDSNLCHPPC